MCQHDGLDVNDVTEEGMNDDSSTSLYVRAAEILRELLYNVITSSPDSAARKLDANK